MEQYRKTLGWMSFTVMLLFSSEFVSSACQSRKTVSGAAAGLNVALTPTWEPGAEVPTPTDTPAAQPADDTQVPFYGTEFVDVADLPKIKSLGMNVVMQDFPRDGSPADWLAYLDAAHEQELQVIAWFWPESWTWNGSEWIIDRQAKQFIETVAAHPALFAVYGLHEPYWNNCEGCGYTTAQQQALYQAIKRIADVPIYSDLDAIASYSARGPDTAFADGVCDYCGVWYYPFRSDGRYEREKLIAQLQADLAVLKERAPNSRLVWIMQSFAQGAPYFLRMPTADEMRDLAAIVYAEDIAGAFWYPWSFDSSEYRSFLSKNPELFPVVREIYELHIAPRIPQPSPTIAPTPTPPKPTATVPAAGAAPHLIYVPFIKRD